MGELITRTANETIADDGFGLAAQLAYYFFLALFPAPLFLVAIASVFPLQHLADTLVTMLSRFTHAP
jgi:membrane protein